MALQRKPVKKSTDPGYPDSQSYEESRRAFLLKLGLSAAGALALSGCGSASATPEVKPVGTSPTPTGTTPPVSQPVVHPPGLPPISSQANPQAPAGGTPIACPAPANPQAAMPGKMAVVNPDPTPPVTPQARMPGEASAPLPQKVPPPVRPEVNIRGDVAVPMQQPPVRPRSDAEGGLKAPSVKKDQ